MKYVLMYLSSFLERTTNQVITFNYMLAKEQFQMSTLLTIFAAWFVIGSVICGLFWLYAHLALIHAESKMKRLEQQFIPANDALYACQYPRHSS